MEMVVVSVFDAAVGAFMRPFFVPSVGAANRSFADEVNRADSEMHKHPSDYSLHMLGKWDDSSGAFETQMPPTRICNASDVLIK